MLNNLKWGSQQLDLKQLDQLLKEKQSSVLLTPIKKLVWVYQKIAIGITEDDFKRNLFEIPQKDFFFPKAYFNINSKQFVNIPSNFSKSYSWFQTTSNLPSSFSLIPAHSFLTFFELLTPIIVGTVSIFVFLLILRLHYLLNWLITSVFEEAGLYSLIGVERRFILFYFTKLLILTEIIIFILFLYFFSMILPFGNLFITFKHSKLDPPSYSTPFNQLYKRQMHQQKRIWFAWRDKKHLKRHFDEQQHRDFRHREHVIQL